MRFHIIVLLTTCISLVESSVLRSKMSSPEKMKDLKNVEDPVSSPSTPGSSEGVTDVESIANPIDPPVTTEACPERPNIVLRERTAEQMEALQYPILEREITRDGWTLTRGDINDPNIRYRTPSPGGGVHIREPTIRPDRAENQDVDKTK